MYLAILQRWASPPERVPTGRSRLRYPRPISSRAVSRAPMTAFKSTASGSDSPRIHALSREMGIAHASAILTPSILQVNTFGFSLVPPQSGQVPIVSIGFSTTACRRPSSELMIDLYIRGIIPSYLADLGQLAGGFFSRIWGLFRKRSSSSGE